MTNQPSETMPGSEGQPALEGKPVLEDKPVKIPKSTRKDEKINKDNPALTVVIQSWWTPILALVMLVVGLLGGYFGRPLVSKVGGIGDTAATVTPVAEATRAPSGDPTYDAIANQQEFMDYVVSHTTNFKGNPDALVTIIEFSDYQ